jgi:23S rRNA (pseudouridine1915-N3)-methyltransferase
MSLGRGVRIRQLSVGKPREKAIAALHDAYAERIRQLGVHYETAWVAEVRPGGRYSDEHVREREARLLLEKLNGRGTVIALHPTGRLITSEELAERFERWASPRVELVVGGPLGLHRDLLERADQRWSLSPLTFPHELVRLLVVEQLYRALTILRGLPYHK